MRTLPIPDTLLGGLSIEAFLDEYWQKKPLLIRGALSGYTSPVSHQDLMQIACTEDAEARLILEKDGDYPWQLLYGPFEEDFHDMPESHWTLLVQEANRYVPEIANLIDHFRFIPSWRIDDVMVSFAKEHGGVGAHVDNYDVFLLQAMGHRRWQIMNKPVVEEILIPDLDISMLQNFRPDEDWVLAPGDMLYLPPRVAHKGTALNDCMTFSVGFRAPSHSDILSSFLGYVAEHTDPLLRYSDPELKMPAYPSEIDQGALSKVRAIIQSALKEEKLIDEWFGQFVTEPKRDVFAYPLEEPLSSSEVKAFINSGGMLQRFSGATFAFLTEESGDAQLFVSGVSLLFPAPIADSAPMLCEAPELSAKYMSGFMESDTFVELLTELINEGFLELAKDTP
ncbi:MAG: cupin domain-containing protein [Rhodothermales bacterium]